MNDDRTLKSVFLDMLQHRRLERINLKGQILKFL